MKQKILLWLVALMATLTAGAQKYTYELGDKIETDNGVYEVIGTNLISNPSFDDGTTGWIAGDGTDLSDSNFDVVQSGGADGGAYLKALGGAGSGSNKSVKTSWQITPGKTYFFSCWALRTASGMSSNTQYSILYLANSDRGTNNEVKKMSYKADTWTQTTAVMEAGEYSYVTAQFGWLNAATSLDCFTLVEVKKSDVIVTTKLEQAIASAESTMSSTVEGNEAGQYKTEVRQALQEAIDKAKAVLASPESQDAVLDAASELNAAVTSYNSKVNPPFDISKKYNFVHFANEGALLTTGDGTVKTAAPDVADKHQVFTFEATSENAEAVGYNIKDEEGRYIYRSGSWDTKASDTQDVTVKNAIFQIVDLGGGVVQFKNMGSGSVLGTDNTSAGSTVYSNKNGGDSKFKWILKEYVPADQRDAEYNFNELLGKAENEYKAVPAGKLGSGVFMYSREAYEKYGAAIEEAKAMKDFSAAIEVLQAAMDEYAKTAVNSPNPTAKFAITQASGAVLNYDAENQYVVLAAEGGTDAQLFNIIASETAGAYYLKNVASGKYVAKQTSSAWNMTWDEEPGSTSAQWTIAAYGENQYTLQNVAGKGYMGSDATAAGSQAYCDKAASAANSHWTIGEYSVSGVLDDVIAQAEELAANTSVGDDYTSVPQSAMDAFLAAIEKAKGVRNTTSDVEAAKLAAGELRIAINTLKESFNAMEEFDTELTYKIVHVSGNALSYADGTPKITALEDGRTTEDQEMILEKVEGQAMTYYIKSAVSGMYLANSGDYNVKWQEGNASGATFIIEHLSGEYLGLKNTAKAYYGTDATASGSILYSDKAATWEYSRWTIAPVQNFDFTAFNAALASANEYAEGMVEGYKIGEYFASVISDFGKDVNAAKSASKKADSQEALDQMGADLLALIETYKSKANATNRADEYLAILVEECEAEAAAVTVGVEKGQYTQANLDAFTTAIGAAKVAGNAEAAIASLKAARETFKGAANSVDRAALKSAIANAEKTTSEAVEGDCNGQYPAEAINNYKEALASAKATYEDITKTQEDVDAAVADLKTAASDFAGNKVVITYTYLKEAIAAAQKKVTDCTPEKGEGPGTYPEKAFTALQNAIAAAQTFVNSATANQEAVDNAGDVLYEAIGTFEDTRVPMDFSELKTLLAAAKQVLAESRNMMAEDDVEELEYAIGVGEEAMKANTQAAIDRAVKILKRDYQLYQNILTDIDAVIAGNAPQGVKVFGINGVAVQGALSKGIYIVKLNNGVTKKITIK